MAVEVLDWLLRSSLALALAIALVLALRPLFRRALGAGAVLWLYLMLPAALQATSLPAPVKVVEVAATPAAPDAHVPVQRVMAAKPAPRGPVASAAASAAPHWALLALLAWSLPGLALAGSLVAQQQRFRRRLGALRRHASGAWQAERSDTGPVVIGLLRPRIVVPADFETRYPPAQQALVLAHERVHLRRGDLPANALACALRCLFWFHPLVHLAAAKLRLDQELACDATVLRLHPRAGRDYATALLNTQLADLGLPVGCAWQSSHPLAWRITMLSKPSPGTTRLALGAGLALLASTATAAALWQQQPATLVALPVVAPVAPPAAPSATRSPLRPAPRPAMPESVERLTLPPPPPPMPEEPAPEMPPPQARVAGTLPDAADYQPPKVVQAKPARIPTLERNPRILQIRNGLVARVDIDEKGEPVAVAVHESGLGAIYARNAIAAVKRWRFEPARRNGVPEPATVLVPVSFGNSLPQADVFAGEAVAHPKPTYLPPPQFVATQRQQAPSRP